MLNIKADVNNIQKKNKSKFVWTNPISRLSDNDSQFTYNIFRFEVFKSNKTY